MADRIRRLAVLTSGEDSPGFNACIRAVVRMALHYGWEPWGVRFGYKGLLEGNFVPLDSRSVSHIIDRGGTFLGALRSDEFKTPAGLRDALRQINDRAVDALVVIGGDGTMRGAQTLHEAGVPVIGVPGTIENDVCGTDVAIGVDTALNTVLDAIDRIKDTASSHQQAFLVEVMGKKSGYLALMAGIAGGAEMVCIPEVPFTLQDVADEVADSYTRGKRHCIIVVSEGATPHATEITRYLEERQEETGFNVRLSLLGYIQRGGSPTARDRHLATCLGAAAVDVLYNGTQGVAMGMIDGKIVNTPLDEVVACTRGIDEAYLEMARMLAR
ncbi:MAG: 6-phosphofructokinase [Anaerolineae bacterium]|jgi:6-phosphofructokinase 1